MDARSGAYSGARRNAPTTKEEKGRGKLHDINSHEEYFRAFSSG